MEGFVKKMELRLILNESDSYKGYSLCRLVVEHAHKLNISGATVLKTKGGFGSRQHIRTSEILRLSDELPVVISIVDDIDKLRLMIAFIKERYKGGLLSLQEIWINE
ncbi:MAG: DUF190 domain-containing protein [Bacteroidales bacterium]|jgi:PII-like signaling protein|nr:DUF190 domain-containing protein [Bacteroidales bacterium]